METGHSRRRVEDARFLTGQGQFVDDIPRPGELHSHVLRAPCGHANFAIANLEAARAAPGIVAIYTEADLRAANIGNLPCIAKVATLHPLIIPPRPALAATRVRHVGDPLAFIVAETRNAARDAAELIEVEYDILPALSDSRAALAPGAPQLWPEAPGNLAFRFQKGDPAAVATALAAAAHIIEITLVNNRVTAAPMETRVAVGAYDETTGFDLVLSGQGVHPLRDQLADDIFHVPRDRVNLLCPDVGGGFGAKNFLYPEYVLILFAARALGRPVRWVGDRSEDFISTAQGRDNHTTARLGLDAAGKFLALEVHTIADMGAYLSTSGPGSPTNAASTAMGGLYDIPAIFMDVRAAFTNTVPVDAYRGAGKPESNYLIERLVDHAALRLNIDRVELRRRNLIATTPHRTALGLNIDSGVFVPNLEAVTRHADYNGFETRRAEAAARGILRGIGIACFLETSRGAPNEAAGIAFEPDGRIALISGTQSNGQGHETSFPQIAADLLGLPIDRFHLVQADTSRVRSGNGHGGARSLPMAGAALVKAVDAVLAKARTIAAQLMQTNEAALTFAEGRFTTPEGAAITLADILRDAPNALDAYEEHISDVFTFPNGCHIAEVEIDPETGALHLARYTAIDDYGRLINPMLTEGQVVGGLAQGIGQALHENMVYEPGTAQLQTGSFMDYAIPRSADLPNFDIAFVNAPTTANRLGVKGAGQAGAIAAPQTIMNAVLDALRPAGVANLDMPATPHRLWAAIQAAKP